MALPQMPPRFSLPAFPPWLSLLLRIGFAAAVIGFLLTQIAWTKITDHLAQLSWGPVLAAFFTLHLSQLCAAMRLRAYLAAEKAPLSPRQAIKLYYAGMFYNTVLPGGVGGDGYIAYILRQQKEMPLPVSIRLLLAARFNGLWILLALSLLLALGIDAIAGLPFAPLFLLLLLLLLALSEQVMEARLLRVSLPLFLRTSLWSLGVQLTSFAAAALILHDMHLLTSWAEYLFLFGLSCVAAVLPISIGGAGLRELVFFYGAPWLGLSAGAGVAFSFGFFSLYVFVALIGACFLSNMRRK